jgi:acyl-coenzyme A synthetase/AMP-(fatty) acid ligase
VTGELRRLCATRLPSFAHPGRIAVLAEFPRLSSGKVDRQKLKAMVAGEAGASGSAAAGGR